MKKWAAYLLILLISYIQSAYSQQKNEVDIDDAFNEMGGKLSLHFFDAITGKPIPNGTVNIEKIGDFSTDLGGTVQFNIPDQDDAYKVVFTKDGYIESTFKIEIVVGTIFFNRFSVSPQMPVENLRIVLDWNQSPRDLDAHFIKQGKYHISYRNMRVSSDKITILDRDDMDGFGPETITSTKIDKDAVYYYLVHDYSNRNNPQSNLLSKSKATIKVFGNNQLLYVFQIPKEISGTTWSVFKIVDGKIMPINQILNTFPIY